MPRIDTFSRDDEQKIKQFDERTVSQMEKAAKRYAQSEESRTKIRNDVRLKGIEEAEDKARVEVRKTFFDVNDALAKERILGNYDLLQINYLSRGLKAGRSVCRIHIRRPDGRPEGYGTGFMVSKELMLTNHHVLPSDLFAMRSLAEFDFEYDVDFEPKRTHYFQLAPDRFYHSDETLDFALVAIKQFSNSGVSLDKFGFLQLTESSGKALTTESVSLIQHPEGSDKHIAIRNNRVHNRFDHFIHYETDTMPGSSGSPVFNDQWNVVALHHAGVPKKNSRGRIVKKDGTLWQQGDSDQEIAWIANEGVRISSIFENLKQKRDWEKGEARILEELGTVSNSDLNEFIIQSGGGATVLVGEAFAKRPNKPAVSHLKISELLAQVENPEVTEQDLAPYFVLSHESTRGIDPLFTINQEMVTIDTPELRESALLLNSANWICKRSRQRKYDNKKDRAKFRIISEGDSWFQYPFILHDVIDHLMADPDFAILSFGEAGDLIRDMVAKAEFTSAVEAEQPSFFLISGGGNDLVAGGGLENYLNRPEASFEPRHLIDHVSFARFKARIASDYTNIFSIVLRIIPDIHILCHGYSYPVPNSGRWLGKPMEELGIVDRQLQTEIIRIIFNEINDVIERTAASFPQTVHYLDVKNVVPARGWFDELHPTNPFYGDVAAEFKNKILELS